MRAFLTRVDSWWWDVCMYEVKKLETSKAMLTVRERESQQGQTTVPFQGRIFCASSPEWLRVGCLGPTFSWRESSQRSVRVDVSHRVLMRSHPVWICCSGTQQQAGYLQFERNYSLRHPRILLCKLLHFPTSDFTVGSFLAEVLPAWDDGHSSTCARR